MQQKTFFTKWSEFNQANPDTNPANNLIKMFNERNSEYKAQKIAEEINTNINPEERAAKRRIFKIRKSFKSSCCANN